MSQVLSSLPLLACPVGMGLMMWLMTRGKKTESTAPMALEASERKTDELTRMRAEIDQLRGAQNEDRVH